MKGLRWSVVIAATIGIISLVVHLLSSGKRVPPQLGQLSLVRTISGADATGLVNKLHGKRVSPRENVVATYGGEGVEATLYLSYYASADSAALVAAAMAQRITAGIPPFDHFRMFEEGKNPVYMCLGLGQAHFFFACGERLYWLAADIGVAEEALVQLRRNVCQ
jgi:hypothetical protein